MEHCASQASYGGKRLDGRSSSRRSAGNMPASISPPPSKRRRLEKEGGSTFTESPRGISIYSWNINGITPFIQPNITSVFSTAAAKGSAPVAPKASLRDFLRRHDWPTLLFLQEVKINPDDVATLRAVRQAVKKGPTESPDSFDYEAHFCLPNDKYNARGFGRKVYGVCSIIRIDFRDRYIRNIRPVDWDKEGRFLVLETQAVGRIPKLAFINVYAVNGSDYAYKDPETGDVTGTRHDRKLRVHELLRQECQALEADGFSVVIAGDLNIARSAIDGFPNLRTFPKQHCASRADFEAKFFSSHSSIADHTREPEDSDRGDQAQSSGLDMIDAFRSLHPDQRAYTFYPRSRNFGESCDRVDLIMLSQTLGQNLVQAGMHETIAERGPSDHVPLYACLEFGEGSSSR